jgi:hypothetical protein
LQRATKKTIDEILEGATFILSFMQLFFSKFAVDKDESNRCYTMARIDNSLIFNELRGRGARIASALIFNDLAMSRKKPTPKSGLVELVF